MIKISSHNSRVLINPIGAELKSLIVNEREFIYQPVAGFWQRSSPILFPIVGRLNNNRYMYLGGEYAMGQHGFARDLVFETIYITENEVHLELRNSNETKSMYPFDFSLVIKYVLSQFQLSVSYVVYNPSPNQLLYSIGAHPAFALSKSLNRYALCFDEDVEVHWFGLFNGAPKLMDSKLNINTLCLKETLFENDTVILKNLKSKQVVLKENQEPLLSITCNTPYFGIWKQTQSPFLCLEPWWGVADFAEHDGDINNKIGILKLNAQDTNTHQWQIAWAN